MPLKVKLGPGQQLPPQARSSSAGPPPIAAVGSPSGQAVWGYTGQSPCMYPRIISLTMHVCHLYLQKPLPDSVAPHPPPRRLRCTSQEAVEDARPPVEVLHGRIQAMGIKRCPSFSKRPGFPCGLRVLVVDEDSSARADAEALLCNCNYVVRNCAAVQANAARGG
jgi:hypothetical protein